MKRIFDLLLAMVLLSFLLIAILIIGLLVKITSKGGMLYFSDRIGKDNHIFKMPKFRTMQVETPTVATHLMKNPNDYFTPIGSFLRRTSLDELPQLFSVLQGNMSFVGPRPALFNQDDLIKLRTKKGVDKLLPGITGWAQVNGRDKLSIANKVDFEVEYLQKQSLLFDIKILWLSILKVLKKEGIVH